MSASCKDDCEHSNDLGGKNCNHLVGSIELFWLNLLAEFRLIELSLEMNSRMRLNLLSVICYSVNIGIVVLALVLLVVA